MSGVVANVGQVFTKVLGEYRRTKNKKLMMVDSLIVYSLATAAVQVQIVFKLCQKRVKLVWIAIVRLHTWFLLAAFLSIPFWVDSFAILASLPLQVTFKHYRYTTLWFTRLFLTVSLRMQLSMSKEFGQITPEKALGDFVFCCIVFLFIVFSFLG